MPSPNFAGKPSLKDINSFRKSLLGWYDKNRRVLPWRALPGQGADPYRVWLSEIMLQQTVVAAVIPYFLKFTERWPRIQDLAAASAEDVMSAWAGLGYYARARNLHKCAQEVAARGGVFPDTVEGLKALPGIGAYTSAAIAAIAFDKPATVVDGNVERVVARYFRITEPLPAGKKPIREYAGYLSDGRADRPGDFAQAMMDLGATVCTPQSPRCALCPVSAGCEARKIGLAEQLPARAAKAAKPYKYGHVYWITDKKGRVLFERRPDKGLLAATVGLPTSEWTEGRAGHASFAMAAMKGVRPVRDHKIFHSFTHFDLELQGWTVGAGSLGTVDPARYFWVDGGNVAELGLPSLFKKFVKIMVH